MVLEFTGEHGAVTEPRCDARYQENRIPRGTAGTRSVFGSDQPGSQAQPRPVAQPPVLLWLEPGRTELLGEKREQGQARGSRILCPFSTCSSSISLSRRHLTRQLRVSRHCSQPVFEPNR